VTIRYMLGCNPMRYAAINGHIPLKSINDVYVEQRSAAHNDGRALENHIKAVHHGAFDTTCPACRELKAKIR
jgi:hypothetical protein